jgi:hypothetical protein
MIDPCYTLVYTSIITIPWCLGLPITISTVVWRLIGICFCTSWTAVAFTHLVDWHHRQGTVWLLPSLRSLLVCYIPHSETCASLGSTSESDDQRCKILFYRLYKINSTKGMAQYLCNGHTELWQHGIALQRQVLITPNSITSTHKAYFSAPSFQNCPPYCFHSVHPATCHKYMAK